MTPEYCTISTAQAVTTIFRYGETWAKPAQTVMTCVGAALRRRFSFGFYPLDGRPSEAVLARHIVLATPNKMIDTQLENSVAAVHGTFYSRLYVELPTLDENFLVFSNDVTPSTPVTSMFTSTSTFFVLTITKQL